MLLYKMDLIGIASLTGASLLSGVFFGFSCYPMTRIIYMSCAGGMILLGSALPHWPRFMLPEFEPFRVAFFFALIASNVVPAIHWTVIATSTELAMFLPKIILMFACFAVGFLFYYTKFPERLFPGRFNIWFGSHMWWHIFVFLGAWVWYQNLSSLYHYHVTDKQCPS